MDGFAGIPGSGLDGLIDCLLQALKMVCRERTFPKGKKAARLEFFLSFILGLMN